MSLVLVTERLRVEHLVLNDAGFILDLVNQPDWKTYIGDKNIETLQAAETYLLQGPINSYLENDFGLYKLSLREDIPIGMVGLVRRPGLTIPDLGYALLPEYYGQGYVTEAAKELLDFERKRLDLMTIAALTVPGHHRSHRVLERLGFKTLGQKEVNQQLSDYFEWKSP